MATYVEQRIQELETVLAQLRAERESVCNEQTLFPGRDAWTLRENYRNEENRRQGLLAIDQSIAGAEQQLAFFRQQIS